MFLYVKIHVSFQYQKLIQILYMIVNISRIIIGQPRRFSGEYSEVENSIIKFITSLSGFFDKNEIFRFDERFTSKIAKKSLISSGVKKKLRSDKHLVDKISASIWVILKAITFSYKRNRWGRYGKFNFNSIICR